MRRAFDEICVQPAFGEDEGLTRTETGVLCAVVGTAVALASTIATGHLPDLLEASGVMSLLTMAGLRI